jgi:CysZ protein
MFRAAFRALGDLLSPDFRRVLWTAIGLTLALFLVVFAGVESVFWFMSLVRWPWLETLLAVVAAVGMLVMFFFLMGPVTSLFAGLFLDRVAAIVEARHYPGDPAGVPLSGFVAIATALQFAGLVLLFNILALPLIGVGIGIFIVVAINAYLLGREYFEMVAMRFMPVKEARALRRANAIPVFMAGLLPAALALVPFVNLAVPLFATSYFVHLFKQVQRSLA